VKGAYEFPAVSARDLSVYYRSHNPATRSIAVNGVNFELPQGEVLALVGETGSGKSTLAQAIALQADIPVQGAPEFRGGALDVLGVPVRGISARRRGRLSLHIGYIPQDAGDTLIPNLTVAENVSYPIFSRDAHFNRADALELVATLIDGMRLPLRCLDQYPYELSKGQRQRVAIARALILEPTLVVADDPTAGIDATVRGAVLDQIGRLQQERLFSAIVVTADLREVRRISTRMAVMHRGTIVGIGEVDEVLGNPTHPYVKGLARSLKAAERDRGLVLEDVIVD
jgi:peptide/nickel transport system ATP-binding protein